MPGVTLAPHKTHPWGAHGNDLLKNPCKRCFSATALDFQDACTSTPPYSREQLYRRAIRTARERPVSVRVGGLRAAALRFRARLREVNPPVLGLGWRASETAVRLALGVCGHIVADPIVLGHPVARAVEIGAAVPRVQWLQRRQRWRRRRWRRNTALVHREICDGYACVTQCCTAIPTDCGHTSHRRESVHQPRTHSRAIRQVQLRPCSGVLGLDGIRCNLLAVLKVLHGNNLVEGLRRVDGYCERQRCAWGTDWCRKLRDGGAVRRHPRVVKALQLLDIPAPINKCVPESAAFG